MFTNILKLVFIIGFIEVAENSHHEAYYKTVNVNYEKKTFKISKPNYENTTILIAITINNNAYSLPTFLKTLETVKCINSRKKCDLWIMFYDCSDQSYEIFTYWLSNTRKLFGSIIMLNSKNDIKTQKKHPELDPLYFSKNIKIRAIKYAMDKNYTYIFFLTGETIIINKNIINILIKKHKKYVIPMPELISSLSSREENSYITRAKKGCFEVDDLDESIFKEYESVKENFLMKIESDIILKLFKDDRLRDRSSLRSDYHFQITKHLQSLGVEFHICNIEKYNYVPKKLTDNSADNFYYLRMEHLIDSDGSYKKPLAETEFLENPKKRKTKLGFDNIYVINLERRAERKARIESAMKDINLSYKIFNAIDNRNIDEDYLKNLNIKVIPKYLDPNSKRPMNYGEIACFLSHYFIWKEMVEKNLEKIIILEDDARFSENFKEIMVHISNRVNEAKLEWDLIYLGRKVLMGKDETWENRIVKKNGHGLVNPSYSYWTVGYTLSLNGAKKLINSNPLQNILPVDEYLPLMFNKQPNSDWLLKYPKRNLNAYAISPSIIEPTHYPGNFEGYVSDTENTKNISSDKINSKDEL